MILWAFFLLFLAVFSLAGEGFVSIYADFQPDLWGRALQRSGLISPTPEEARQVPTVEAPEGGFLTGVILNREQGEQLMALLRESGSWTDGMISLELLGGEEPPTLEVVS